jgi:protein-disulfide isomerase
MSMSHLQTALVILTGSIAGVVLFLVVKPYAPDLGGLSGSDPRAYAVSWSEAPRFDVEVSGRPAIDAIESHVTVVEFTDYGCPFCRRHASDVLPALMDSLSHGITYVVRHFPIPALTPNAMSAAIAAECAFRQNRFWEYKAALQDELEGFQKERLRANAAALGLDEAEFDWCIDEESVRSIVERDILDAWEYGVTGTPTFFINGKRFRGARSSHELLEYIRLASLEVNSH